MGTPSKINMEPKNRPSVKGKSSEPNLHDFGSICEFLHGGFLLGGNVELQGIRHSRHYNYRTTLESARYI